MLDEVKDNFERRIVNKYTPSSNSKCPHGYTEDNFLESALKGDQPDALAYIKEFLASDSKEMCLSGVPGAGKTHLIRCLKAEYNHRMSLSAPTHKAKVILSRSAGAPAITIQKLNGLRPNLELESFSIDNLKLSITGPIKTADFDLHCIDEGSMLGEDYLKLMRRHMNSDAKVIYFGDKYQLPPVNKAYNINSPVMTSPVFDLDWKFQMNHVIRQAADNKLLDLLIDIRSDIDTNSNAGMTRISKNRTDLVAGEGYALMRQADGIKRAATMIRKYLDKNEYNSYIVLAYSNNLVQQHNKRIRSIVNPSDYCITEGDILTSNVTIYDENMQPTILNSFDYRVNSVRLRIDNTGMQLFVCVISSIDEEFKEYDVMFVNTWDAKSWAMHIEKRNALHNRITPYLNAGQRAQYWKDYYAYVQSHLVVGMTEGIGIPEFDHAYAKTIHKSQGSTYKECAVDLSDVNKAGHRSFSLRLLHVGVSRAKHRVDLMN